MCGICGIVDGAGRPVEGATLRRLSAASIDEPFASRFMQPSPLQGLGSSAPYHPAKPCRGHWSASTSVRQTRIVDGDAGDRQLQSGKLGGKLVAHDSQQMSSRNQPATGDA